MRSLKRQGALLKKLAIGLSVMGGVVISLPALVQANQLIAQVEPTSAELEPTLETSPAPELDGEILAAGDIVDVAINSGSFETLVTALEAAGLVDTLSGEGPYTVFAPTDEAFAALPEGTVKKLLMPENQAMLAQILTYHVVSGELTSGSLAPGAVTTVEGSDVIVEIEETVKVNGATVITPDISATNGVIHAIDQVIMPPALFSELLSEPTDAASPL